MPLSASKAEAAGGAAAGGAGSSTYTPLGAGERARFQARRDEQIERLWAAQTDQVSAQEEHDDLPLISLSSASDLPLICL